MNGFISHLNKKGVAINIKQLNIGHESENKHKTHQRNLSAEKPKRREYVMPNPEVTRGSTAYSTLQPMAILALQTQLQQRLQYIQLQRLRLMNQLVYYG